MAQETITTAESNDNTNKFPLILGGFLLLVSMIFIYVMSEKESSDEGTSTQNKNQKQKDQDDSNKGGKNNNKKNNNKKSTNAKKPSNGTPKASEEPQGELTIGQQLAGWFLDSSYVYRAIAIAVIVVGLAFIIGGLEYFIQGYFDPGIGVLPSLRYLGRISGVTGHIWGPVKTVWDWSDKRFIAGCSIIFGCLIPSAFTYIIVATTYLNSGEHAASIKNSSNSPSKGKSSQSSKTVNDKEGDNSSFSDLDKIAFCAAMIGFVGCLLYAGNNFSGVEGTGWAKVGNSIMLATSICTISGIAGGLSACLVLLLGTEYGYKSYYWLDN